MADDMFSFDDETIEDVKVTPDVVEGLQAERDPASVMPDPFTVDKSKPRDVIGESLDNQVSARARETAEKLHSKPKDNIIIPPDRMNREDNLVTVQINGWPFHIQRGEKVALPGPVVDQLVNAKYGPNFTR